MAHQHKIVISTRRVLYFNLASLDGSSGAEKRGLDWPAVEGAFNSLAAEELEAVDLLLFSRATYQLFADYWPTRAAIRKSPAVAKKMNAMSKLVFSRTPIKVDWTNTALIKVQIVAKVAALKRQPGKNLIIFGSPGLAATLTKNGLIDEYRTMVNPIVLENGDPLFPCLKSRFDLRHAAGRVFPSGNVLLTFQPKSASAKMTS